MKKFLLGALAIIIIVISIVGLSSNSGGSGGNGDKDKNTSTQAKPTKPSTQKVEGRPVSFEDMVTAYSTNGVTADDTYQGKWLEVQGTVKTVTQGVMSGYDVVIEAGAFVPDNDFEKTDAIISVDKETATKVVSGQHYTFIAKGTGATVLDDKWVSSLTFKDGKLK